MYPWNMMFACTIGITLVFMLQIKGSCNSLFGCVFKNENRLRILAKSQLLETTCFSFVIVAVVDTVLWSNQESRRIVNTRSLHRYGVLGKSDPGHSASSYASEGGEEFWEFDYMVKNWKHWGVSLYSEARFPLSIIKMRWKLLSWNVSFTLTDNHILWSILVVFHLSHEYIGQ